ncbi:MAG: T9SS type A sorting domain-containing protein [Bacteroidota bacterium]
MKQFIPYLLTTIILIACSSVRAQTWQLVGSAGISAGDAHDVSLALRSDDTPYLAYRDGSVSEEVTVLAFDGSNWNAVGTVGFSAGKGDYVDIEFDNTDVPYVVYRDYANSFAATVHQFSGGSWSTLGSAGFTPGGASFTDMAIDGTTPYVAFSDFASSLAGKVSVMKYSGGAWAYVGTAGFSAGKGFDISIEIHGGTPYVSYRDQSESNKLTVMKFESGSWSVVGTAGFTPGSAEYSNLVLDGSGNPYVAYQDGALGTSKLSVMTFRAGSWIQVGAQGFSVGEARSPDLKIDGSGIPYVAFRDFGYTNNAVVMYFDNGTSTWVNYGNPGFSAGLCSDVNLEIASSGRQFVAYKDLTTSNRATVNDIVSAFPVEFDKFEGVVKNGYNELSWSTASELNNDYFVLEKSQDGVEFQAVNQIDGAGTSQASLNYTTRDYTPFPKLTFYRLKQVDFNGTFSYSHAIRLEGSVEEAKFMEVFPNPSRGQFQVTAVLGSETETSNLIRVMSLQGKVVYQKSLERSAMIGHQVTLNHLTPGFYFVQAISAHNSIQQRILIQP